MNIAVSRPCYNPVKVIPLSDPGKGLDYSTIAKTVKPVVQFLKGRSKRPWTLRPKANRRSIPRRRPASAPLKGGLPCPRVRPKANRQRCTVQGSLTSGLPWAGRSAHGSRTLDPPWTGCSAHGVPAEGRPTKAHRAGLWPQAPLGQGTPHRGPTEGRPTKAHRAGVRPQAPLGQGTPRRVPAEGRPTKAHRARVRPQAPLGQGAPRTGPGAKPRT